MPDHSKYIVVWRRNPNARYLDVAQDQNGKIATFTARDEATGLLDSEDSLIRFVGSNDTDRYQVDAELAHKVLGWDIP